MTPFQYTTMNKSWIVKLVRWQIMGDVSNHIYNGAVVTNKASLRSLKFVACYKTTKFLGPVKTCELFNNTDWPFHVVTELDFDRKMIAELCIVSISIATMPCPTHFKLNLSVCIVTVFTRCVNLWITKVAVVSFPSIFTQWKLLENICNKS